MTRILLLSGIVAAIAASSYAAVHFAHAADLSGPGISDQDVGAIEASAAITVGGGYGLFAMGREAAASPLRVSRPGANCDAGRIDAGCVVAPVRRGPLPSARWAQAEPPASSSPVVGATVPRLAPPRRGGARQTVASGLDQMVRSGSDLGQSVLGAPSEASPPKPGDRKASARPAAKAPSEPPPSEAAAGSRPAPATPCLEDEIAARGARHGSRMVARQTQIPRGT